MKFCTNVCRMEAHVIIIFMKVSMCATRGARGATPQHSNLP